MKTKNDVQQECLQELLKHRRSTCGLSPGMGKTYVGMQFIQKRIEEKKYEKKILVVAPKKSIFDSWNFEMDKFNFPYKDRIEYSTYLSITKQISNDYDVVILDEVHNIRQNHLPFFATYRGEILGLTGTPPRYKESIKGKIIEKLCPVVFTYITDEAVENHILNDYRIIVHLVSLSHNKTIKKENKKGGYFYTSEFDEYNFWTNAVDNSFGAQKTRASIMRMRCLMTADTKFQYAKDIAMMIDDKCLVFCNTKEQADEISSCSIYSGNTNAAANLEKFKKGECLLASCVNQLSEGVNIPNLKACVIIHAFGNERTSSQKLSRTLRLNVNDTSSIHIICFRDSVDYKWTMEAIKDYDENKIRIIG
jgi:superfamily II DNA or RNA helicase